MFRQQRKLLAKSEPLGAYLRARLTETTVDCVGREGALWGRKALTTRTLRLCPVPPVGAGGGGRASLPGATPGRHLEVRGKDSPLCSAWLRATATARACRTCWLVQPRRFVVKDALKPPERWETKRQRKKSWWVRPETFRIATLVLRFLNAVTKLIDLLSR